MILLKIFCALAVPLFSFSYDTKIESEPKLVEDSKYCPVTPHLPLRGTGTCYRFCNSGVSDEPRWDTYNGCDPGFQCNIDAACASKKDGSCNPKDKADCDASCGQNSCICKCTGALNVACELPTKVGESCSKYNGNPCGGGTKLTDCKPGITGDISSRVENSME